MELVRCPNCGALSAVHQKMCPQCETRLDLPPAPSPAQQSAGQAPARICKHCRHATVFPPVGHKLSPEEVWCARTNAAKPTEAAGGECFELSFTWGREERLD